jgi:hypothetical protein
MREQYFGCQILVKSLQHPLISLRHQSSHFCCLDLIKWIKVPVIQVPEWPEHCAEFLRKTSLLVRNLPIFALMALSSSSTSALFAGSSNSSGVTGVTLDLAIGQQDLGRMK